MGIKEEFKKAFDDYFIKSSGDAGYSAYRHAVRAGAELGAKWAINIAVKEVCHHDDNFPRYKDCCYEKDRLRQLAKELE